MAEKPDFVGFSKNANRDEFSNGSPINLDMNNKLVTLFLI